MNEQCGIIRFEKRKRTALHPLMLHNSRLAKTHSTNEDIDSTQSHRNYTFIKCDNYKSAIDNLLKQYNVKTPRKNAIMLLDFIVSATPEYINSLSLEEQKIYFSECLSYLQEVFGKDRVIGADIHMDEATPHMHAQVVPLTKDGRLSAKDWFGGLDGKKKCEQFQDAIYEKVFKRRGLARRKNPEKTKHKSTLDYKLEAQAAKLAAIEERIAAAVQQEQAAKLQRDAMLNQCRDVAWRAFEAREKVRQRILRTQRNFMEQRKRMRETATRCRDLLHSVAAMTVRAETDLQALQEVQNKATALTKKLEGLNAKAGQMYRQLVARTEADQVVQQGLEFVKRMRQDLPAEIQEQEACGPRL